MIKMFRFFFFHFPPFSREPNRKSNRIFELPMNQSPSTQENQTENREFRNLQKERKNREREIERGLEHALTFDCKNQSIDKDLRSQTRTENHQCVSRIFSEKMETVRKREKI